jgi:hypothetical protein
MEFDSMVCAHLHLSFVVSETSRNAVWIPSFTRHHSSLSGGHDTDRGERGPNALGRGLPTLPAHVGILYRWRGKRNAQREHIRGMPSGSCRNASQLVEEKQEA